MIPAVVPVKALAASKSRMRPRLGDATALRLTLAMLGDVLEALLGVRALGPVAVVTPDAEVERTARAAGAEARVRPDPGLNAAVDGAAASLAPAGPLLVVLGDVVGVRSAEIEILLGALDDAGGRGVALAPASDGGTSALLRVPSDCIAASFGPGSAKAHRDLAVRAGLPFREIALPSLALDIDEPDDLDTFVRSGTGGDRTRALLCELGWKPRS
ncbi:MAG: 2-phospho-L-lactate guanylyltransferase [Myxococcales bacterium]|nr:2-phospho-L-lactate guanylyltransferase [Myxococcales bacterium]